MGDMDIVTEAMIIKQQPKKSIKMNLKNVKIMIVTLKRKFQSMTPLQAMLMQG